MPSLRAVAGWQPQPDKARVAFIKASFTFVARDEDNNAMEVPRLVTSDERTRSWYLKGQSRQNARKQFRALSLTNQPPTHSELELVYELFMSPVHKQDSAATNGATNAAAAPVRVHSNATTMSTTLICHPQNRNIHGKVFGGYLMRHAYVLYSVGAGAAVASNSLPNQCAGSNSRGSQPATLRASRPCLSRLTISSSARPCPLAMSSASRLLSSTHKVGTAGHCSSGYYVVVLCLYVGVHPSTLSCCQAIRTAPCPLPSPPLSWTPSLSRLASPTTSTSPSGWTAL